MESIKKGEHQQHWARLAAEAQAFAEYEESRGHYGGVYRNKAHMYLRTVEALKLEEATGLPHCTCCLKPPGVIHARA